MSPLKKADSTPVLMGWSIIFFGFSLYFIAFIWLLALLVLVAAMIWQFYMVGPPAAYLQLPYLTGAFWNLPGTGRSTSAARAGRSGP